MKNPAIAAIVISQTTSGTPTTTSGQHVDGPEVSPTHNPHTDSSETVTLCDALAVAVIAARRAQNFIVLPHAAWGGPTEPGASKAAATVLTITVALRILPSMDCSTV